MDYREAHCQPTLPMSSSSLWLGKSPFGAELPLVLAQIAIIVAVSQALHIFLQYLQQPLIVSQLLTGLILGPSGLGRLTFFRNVLYSKNSWTNLNMFAFVGLLMFRFVMGLKTEVGMIRRVGRRSWYLALAGRVTPVLFIVVARAYFSASLPANIVESNVLTGLYQNWSSTSFIVVACLLNELNLLNSKIGRLAISASLVDNLFDMAFRIVGATILSSMHGSVIMMVSVFLTFCFLVIFIVTVARPVALWIIQRTPEGEQLDEKYFVLILVLALGVGLISEMIGYHAGVGILLLGLALPSGKPLGYTVVERLESVVTSLTIPVLMAKPGFMSNTTMLMADVGFWECLQFFIFLCVMGKFLGLMFCAMVFCRMRALEALPLSLIMCAKGFYEVERLLSWVDLQMIDAAMVTIFTLSIVLTTAVVTPLIIALYKPSKRYADCKRRTVQHSQVDQSELNFLVCIHSQENVTPILNLLQTIHHASSVLPMRLTVLNLVPLVGRATTVLAPYTKQQKSSNPSQSDHIMNAFFQFEWQERTEEAVVLQPFISISPHATMHDDVCSLALDTRACMVLLPFHKDLAKRYDVQYSANQQARQAVNNSVIDYISCSIAILVNRKTVSGEHEKVAIYFIGGADDREALSLALQMARNPKVALTIFRLVPAPGELQDAAQHEDVDVERLADEEMLAGARGVSKRVAYREEVVSDGERLLSMMQTTTVGFDLLIAGRREGPESSVTWGLSAWREFPELGIIGDMLASPDFPDDFSILVVQQQSNLNH